MNSSFDILIAQKYNHRPMPGSSHPFRLNWGQHSGGKAVYYSLKSFHSSCHKSSRILFYLPFSGPEYSLFVGEIGFDVSEDMIAKAFKAKFPSCIGMKVCFFTSHFVHSCTLNFSHFNSYIL